MMNADEFSELVLIFPDNHMILTVRRDNIDITAKILLEGIKDSYEQNKSAAIGLSTPGGPAFVVVKALFGFYFRGIDNKESFNRELLELHRRQTEAIEKANKPDRENWKNND